MANKPKGPREQTNIGKMATAAYELGRYATAAELAPLCGLTNRQAYGALNALIERHSEWLDGDGFDYRLVGNKTREILITSPVAEVSHVKARALIVDAVKNNPDMTHKQIGELCGCSASLVQNVKREHGLTRTYGKHKKLANIPITHEQEESQGIKANALARDIFKPRSNNAATNQL